MFMTPPSEIEQEYLLICKLIARWEKDNNNFSFTRTAFETLELIITEHKRLSRKLVENVGD